jgi:uncharacterized protein with GYD domain
MADYLLQLSYSPDAWAALLKHPQNRVKAVKGAVEKLGGKVGPFWLSFGDHDLVGVLDMPDNTSAAAFSMALSAGGACKRVKTTPLLKLDDAVAAMKKAANCGYKPATGKKK